MRFNFATQNMTEGPVTNALRECDLVALQEIPHATAIRNGFGREWNFYFPDEDKHQCLAWRKSMFEIAGEPRYHRFHRSGKADPRIPDAIRTPGRGLLEQPLRFEEHADLLDLFGTWTINSWNPFRKDQWTDERKWLFSDKSWPVIVEELHRSRNQGRYALLGGDLNSVKARLGVSGYKSFPFRGLDRQFYPISRSIRLVQWHMGPKTGVGSQMRHHALIGTFDIDLRRGGNH